MNKSLSALASVVQSLSIKNDTTFHIPYRDSKLTRILSECLGGSAYTTLILTCTLNEYNLSETRNTLLFGERAKKIRNKPVINIEYNADKNPIIKDMMSIYIVCYVLANRQQIWEKSRRIQSENLIG